MNLLLDTSVWIDELRQGAVAELLPAMSGKFTIWLDAIAAAELYAGCRSKNERDVVDRLTTPFEKVGRLVRPELSDFRRAATAISRLREQGLSLRGSGGVLLDGLIATAAVRIGALLVTLNIEDFLRLKRQLPLRVESLADFKKRFD